LEETPEGRLAAAAITAMHHIRDRTRHDPDVADLRELLRPFVHRELIHARMQELQSCRAAATLNRETLIMREKDLFAELAQVEKTILEKRL
jgi:hypothetical protein